MKFKHFNMLNLLKLRNRTCLPNVLCAFVFMSIWFSLQFFQLATLLTFESLGLRKRPRSSSKPSLDVVLEVSGTCLEKTSRYKNLCPGFGSGNVKSPTS